MFPKTLSPHPGGETHAPAQPASSIPFAGVTSGFQLSTRAVGPNSVPLWDTCSLECCRRNPQQLPVRFSLQLIRRVRHFSFIVQAIWAATGLIL